MNLLLDITRTYPARSALMIACLLVGVAAEGVGLSMLLPLLAVLIGSETSEEPSTLQRVVGSSLDALGIEATLGNLLSLFVVATVAQSALLLLARRQVGYTAARMITDLRLALLRALATARWSYYTQQSVGAVSNAMSAEAGRAALAYMNGGTVVSLSIQACLYLAIAFAVSWEFMLAALVAAGIVTSAMRYFVRLTRRAGQKQTLLMHSLLRRLADSLQAVKPLKAMSRESLLGSLLEKDTRSLDRALRKQVLSIEARKAVQMPLNAIFAAAGIYAAATYWKIPLVELGILALVFTNMMSSVGKAQRQYQQMCVDESAYWALRDRIAHAEHQQESTGGGRTPSLVHGISLDRVAFSYDDHRILDAASMEIRAGQITALVGASGEGKTSVVDLVCGLLQPDSGQVRIDGVPLEDIDVHAWRGMIGYVPQEMFLLHESVRTNVTLGEDIAEPEVESALRLAGAWDFVARLPEGVDTLVGERGSRLSGGQRQRISIARALVHQPKLLIMDEATSGLDSDTESAIWASMRRLHRELTILAISHQPQLASVADRIYRVEAGKIGRVIAESPPTSRTSAHGRS